MALNVISNELLLVFFFVFFKLFQTTVAERKAIKVEKRKTHPKPNSSGQRLHFSGAGCSQNGCQLQTGQLANYAAAPGLRNENAPFQSFSAKFEIFCLRAQGNNASGNHETKREKKKKKQLRFSTRDTRVNFSLRRPPC